MRHIESDQNFWQLACITGVALGLPAMVIGGQLAKEYGAGTALLSIGIGNILLWVIGLGIVSMAQGKNHAIENVKGYLGKYVSIFAALIWVLAFLIWYAIQIKGALVVAEEVFPNMKPTRIGSLLGILTAIVSLGGIRWIKSICVWGLPLLVGYVIYAVATFEQIPSFQGTWGISFPAILAVVMVWLPGIVNLPTLFRHSASKDDSILGLCFMAGFHTFFQIFTVFVAVQDPIGIISRYAGDGHNAFGLVVTVGFVCLAYLCINLVNIYFASAGWEAIVFRHKNSQEYLIVGLAGTAVYLLLDTFTGFSVNGIEIAVTSFIASLGIVLIIDFLIRMIVRHRPRPFEQFWSSICWLVGCVASVRVQAQSLNADTVMTYGKTPLLAGILASCLAFLLVLFVEETVWAIRRLPKGTY